MYQGKSVSVVVPAYNEESQIRGVIDTLPDYIDHIVVVDDQSKDATAKVVAERATQDPRVILIRHEKNSGVGAAIASGYKWSASNNIDVAVVMAGDGQMDPKDLPKILDPVIAGEADYSKANRLASGKAYEQIPRIRYYGNSVLSLLTKVASGYWHVADSQTGYTAINRKALTTIKWDRMYKRYGQPNDLLVKLNVHGFRVKDVPLEPVYNVGEQSKMKVRKVVFTISWLLVKGFFWRLKEKYIIRDFHPLVLFYLLGVTMLGISLGFFIHTVYLWSVFGHAPKLSALAWVMSFAIGLQCVFFAMWFDMENNRSLRA